MAGKISDTKNYVRDDMPGYFYQAELFGIDSSLSWREVRFRDQEFAIGRPTSKIKYDHSRF